MKKLLYTIVTLLIWLWVSHGYDLSFPSGLTWTFPGIDQNYSLVDFHIQNGFGWVFLWRDNKTLSVGQDLVVWSDTIDGCMQQLQWFYYNNQRWFRLWPLDQNSLTGMQSIDSSYNALTLTGGLYTDCDGVDSNNVYWAIGHIRGGHTYWILGWINFDFSNKTWIPTFSGSFLKSESQATGWIFDSQWAIGEFVGINACMIDIIDKLTANMAWLDIEWWIVQWQAGILWQTQNSNTGRALIDFLASPWWTEYSYDWSINWISGDISVAILTWSTTDQLAQMYIEFDADWSWHVFVWVTISDGVLTSSIIGVFFHSQQGNGFMFANGWLSANILTNSTVQAYLTENFYTLNNSGSIEYLTGGTFGPETYTLDTTGITDSIVWDDSWYLSTYAFLYDNSCIESEPICWNNIVEDGEECDGWENCTDECMIKEVKKKTTGWGGWWMSMDYCPDGDFSGSYYDGKCGTPPEHGAPIVELIGKACIYDDADYLANGPFTDTTNHRGYPYTEIMRVSCMHRGRWIGQWLWIYEPNSGITRAEILKTIVKILGVEFEDFSIQTEDAIYPFSVQFADVPQDHRFAWYANYALNKWLVSWMAEMRNGQRYLNPDQPATRYEAIQAMMTAYNLINNDVINTNQPSVLGDVIDPNNPYYQSVRQAEALWFISWVPQTNGSYNFEWIRNITRAEFAKIVSVPFSEQLFDIDEVVLNSQLYKIVVQAINKATGDKFVFINTLVQKLEAIDDYTFIMDFKIQKELFLEKLEELLIRPLVEQELMENN